ncbi:MAG: hypothetical protein QNK89_07225 [Lacinutrix sp.]|uniref:hypothetical protein n=1 Tax=Lacinutrix sp. TaxID=1937692 RepID=UPI0030A00901
MKKFKKAVIYALILTVVINGFGFFIGAINSSLDSMIIEFRKIARISIPLFFIPAFLSIMFYKKDVFSKVFKGLKHFLIPIIISFIAVYLLVYFNLSSSKKISIGALHRVARSNAFLSLTIFIFSSFIIYLKNSNTQKKINVVNLRPSLIKVFLVFFLVTTAFNILLYFMGNSSWTGIGVVLRIFVSGSLIKKI